MDQIETVFLLWTRPTSKMMKKKSIILSSDKCFVGRRRFNECSSSKSCSKRNFVPILFFFFISRPADLISANPHLGCFSHIILASRFINLTSILIFVVSVTKFQLVNFPAFLSFVCISKVM